MLTDSAARSLPRSLGAADTVVHPRQLLRRGWTQSMIRHQLRARRWQRAGRAIVLHNGPLQPHEKVRVVLLSCGSRSALTAFSAAEVHGLQSWERRPIDTLLPAGVRLPRLPGIVIRPHYTGSWSSDALVPSRRLHRPAPALLRAAATFASPRPACAILAAGVQQRIVTADELRETVIVSTRVRHRKMVLAAINDIEQGAQALSEIDFARLCRRHDLPEPSRQAIRVEPSGKRRYLDVEWRRGDGRRVVAEIDGALHLAAQRWWNDQLRQNELAIADDLVLRFPAVVVRCEELPVVSQLRRALFPDRPTRDLVAFWTPR